MVTTTHGSGGSDVLLVSQLSSVTTAAANEVQREFRTVCVMVLLKSIKPTF